MIRRAEEKDIPALRRLLYQVHRVHADIRPDIFVPGGIKYTDEDLSALLADGKKPVFVLIGEDGEVAGYAFCVLQETEAGPSLAARRTLYVDDICVDRDARRSHVGTRLYAHVRAFAKAEGCSSITLNVWEGNDAAKAFYTRMGMRPLKTTLEEVL
ncbi:MAG: GNAT family N-acetyltransferase [Lachnospiraceae bacterium]|nr:GNAT family N-acetyltransferase [Lachnospiraceae bacterium]